MIDQTMTSEQYRRMVGLTPADDHTARNVLRGKVAQAVGESFQSLLNTYHARMMRDGGFLYILETKPPMRAVAQGRGKPPHYILLGSGPCDYVFAMTNGLAGSFDAKSTANEKYFSWPKNRLHQLDTLRQLHDVSGGKAPAFALVEWRAHGDVMLHPIATIADDNIVRREHGVYVPLWVDAGAWETVVVRLWEVSE